MTSTNLFGVGIVGCGLIGEKRARALGAQGKLIACADINVQKAEELANKYHATPMSDWKQLLLLPEINIVIVSTLHDALAEISLAAVKAGKHVLVEKPAARSYQELLPILDAAEKGNVKVRVGFNHRYHPALQKAKKIVDSGSLGHLMFIRARYGHGGRVGYDSEWRSNPQLSGGGELIDQGPHLIDLSRWFLGDFTEVQGFAHTYYWDMPVDDNGFMMLKTSSKQVAFLHASCTEWKNLFSMEIYGKNGKLEIAGLGGSYGLEKLTHYEMLPQMGPPLTTSWEFPRGDNSWELEMDDFYEDVCKNRDPSPGLEDAIAALKIINQIYRESGYDYCS